MKTPTKYITKKQEKKVYEALMRLEPLDRLVAIALAYQGHKEALKRLFEERLGKDWMDKLEVKT